MASKRHVKANNPLVDGYDPEKPSSHILFLDAKNLYGWAMSQYLSTGGSWWVDNSQQRAKTIAEKPADGPEGFILEVDLEYPQDLHNAFHAYPLTPERMVVQKTWMSEYQHNLIGVGWRRQRLKSCMVRTAMCFTIVICGYTCLWACVWVRSVVPSGSTKALG